MKRFSSLVIFCLLGVILMVPQVLIANNNLTPEENLWLKSRNNTIIVYPRKNFPPYSYQNSSGTPQGLAIDYLELIVQKVGAKIEYLPARFFVQILDDFKQNKKGDVLVSISESKEKEDFLYFSDTFIAVPAVIVVRKDIDTDHTLTLNDLSGKKVAISYEYAIEEFVRTMNPRIVIESVVDDELGLQQVVLGEVDAAVMDIASLSYYLSKQVLNSVKVVGNTGFEYKFTFAVSKDKAILQSIINKGLQQISARDRQILNDKWITLPNNNNKEESFWSNIYKNFNGLMLYILLCTVIVMIILLLRHKHFNHISRFNKRREAVKELEEEIAELEDTSKELIEELNEVKTLESRIKEKIENIEK